MDDLFYKEIKFLKGVGEKRARLLEKLGVDSVGALLRFYPRSYDDWSSPTTVMDADTDGTACISATITENVSERYIRRGMTIYSVIAADQNGAKIKISFFNNPYVKKLLPKGSRFIFCGKLRFDYGRAEMTSPSFIAQDSPHKFVPRYRQTEGINSRTISQLVANALELLPEDMPDPVPESVRLRAGVCGVRQALYGIHFPENKESLETARRRLVFEELFVLQLGLLRTRGQERGENPYRLSQDNSEEFYKLLPFEPTGAQERAVSDGVRDMMRSSGTMARLVQGDVGSGKTAVAAALCYCACRGGFQAALMAPTEILAEQHCDTLRKLLKPTGLNVALLTGSVRPGEKRALYEELANGSVDIAVGTHALIAQEVSFARLGLVITDEQHRFGVGQRAALSSKGAAPHLLVMSATPIPRTLALMIFGELDVSVLNELPKGRIPVETFWVTGDKRTRAYNFIKKHLDAGKQAFIVCSLVEEGDSGLIAAQDYAARLASGEFAGYSVGLLHGRMRPADKEHTMRSFAQGKIQLLVSTTVVEVGVDVPNAVIMLIENAERFGLSQLHQLRGRVGRGQDKSYCILISDAKSEQTAFRLKTMERTNDGFEISGEDLKLRGPGDFFGERQHGLPRLGIADLSSDMDMFDLARSQAQSVIEEDPGLENHRLLAAEADRLFDGGTTLN